MQSSNGGRSNCRPWVVVAVALGISAATGAAAAQQETPPLEPETSTLRSLVDLVPLPIEPKGLPADITELCHDKPAGPAWMTAWVSVSTLVRSRCCATLILRMVATL
jgi:hypothetical protein